MNHGRYDSRKAKAGGSQQKSNAGRPPYENLPGDVIKSTCEDCGSFRRTRTRYWPVAADDHQGPETRGLDRACQEFVPDAAMIGRKTIQVFAGKGGVGKTTCAAGTALHYAKSAHKTLVISTDPTPSLADIFEVASNHKLVKVDECLYMHELGLDEIRQMWDTKFGSEVYEVFSSFVDIGYPEFVDFMTSLLPGLGDEFMVDYIRQLSLKEDFDVIIWDTAPLGQTLTLLGTPAMLRQHLRMAPRIYSRLKVSPQSRKPVLEIIKRWEKLSAENITFLSGQVDFSVVTIAEALAVNQLKGIFAELDRHGLKLRQLIVNNLVPADGSAFLVSRAEQQERYMKSIQKTASGMRIIEVPMFPGEIRGLSRLSELEGYLFPFGNEM